MAGELQARVLDVLVKITGGELLSRRPDWLQRPAASECGSRWSLVSEVYSTLTDLELPPAMPPRERREVDAVIRIDGSPPRIVEIDEAQHFNQFRACTLDVYEGIPVAFDVPAYGAGCSAKSRLEGGGFAKPKPPLFPGDGGRHRQRAFRDLLADVVPLEHGYAPTLRIAHFEVEGWIYGSGAAGEMERLLSERFAATSAEWREG